jgi:hypothetical protein
MKNEYRTFTWRSFAGGMVKSAAFLSFYVAGYVTAHVGSEIQIINLERNVDALVAQVESYKESIRRIDELQVQLEALKHSHEQLKESNRLLFERIEKVFPKSQQEQFHD